MELEHDVRDYGAILQPFASLTPTYDLFIHTLAATVHFVRPAGGQLPLPLVTTL